MYPKLAGVPSRTPLAQRTSSAVASRAGTSRTSTSPTSGSRAPARTASTMAWVPPEREGQPTSSRASDIGGSLPQLPLEHLAGGVHGQLVDHQQPPGHLEPAQRAPGVG